MIKACRKTQFINNLKEISSYIGARRNKVLINNKNRLINLIEVYFVTLLFFIKNSDGKYVVNLDNQKFIVEFGGKNDKGKEIKLSLTDIAESFVKDILTDLKKIMNLADFQSILLALNKIYMTPQIPHQNKISIINAENKVFDKYWRIYIRQLPEKISIETIQIRKKFILKILTNQKEYLVDPNFADSNLEALYKGYEFYFKALINVSISNNHFTDIFSLIYNELQFIESLDDVYNIDKNRIIFFNLTQLISNNHIFQIENQESIKEVIDDYLDLLSTENIKKITELLQFSPDNIELGDLSIEMVDPDFSGIDVDKIQTVISFVASFPIDKSQKIQSQSETIIIEFNKIKNLYDDPIYNLLDDSELNLSGLPLCFLADSLHNLSLSTNVNFIISYFYHPDFNIENEKLVRIDNPLEKAKRGGNYYPHKDIIIEELIKLHNEDKLPIDIDLNKLNSNLISNYIVSYFYNGKLLHHKLHTITNFDSYINAKTKYYEKFDKLIFDNNAPYLRDFILNTVIRNNKSFLDFCFKFLELTLKKSIEIGGMQKSLWIEKNNKVYPKRETESQKIIYNLIRYVAEMKGIIISRETVSSNGSLDFYFQYTKDNLPMKICIELKNAHHQDIEHGIKSQLPQYINDTGKREGIFLVLWFKGSNFNKPSKFDSIESLDKYLTRISPKKLRIKTLIIDCSYDKKSPSTK